MGQLGDLWDHFVVVVDMGSCTWCITSDDSCAYRCMVLYRVSLILLCCKTVLTIAHTPCCTALQFPCRLLWTRTASTQRSIARHSPRSAASRSPVFFSPLHACSLYSPSSCDACQFISPLRCAFTQDRYFLRRAISRTRREV